ncbi:MAG: hypothetical protein A2808_03910 [Candidatus Moranbacteria bacterium RIFCSPHIGHO2_01_FULL_55_24]|nr:MAG: hypothetical protein A2808_03910 [Candidatus Moranbacteria bacterium RIFCSPHIGHO2_01_FULL_55_24]
MPEKPFTLLSLPALKSTPQAIKKFPFPIDFTAGKYPDLELAFHKGAVQALHRGIDIREFSFVWLTSGWNYRDIAYALHLYLESAGTPHSYVEKSPSKVTDCMVFALNGLPIPDTVFVSRSNVEKSMGLIKKTCGYPLIIKDIRGARGKHSEFVASESDLLEKMAGLPKNKSFLFQRYIPNEYDWGIMVVNGVVVAGEKSYHSDGEFRNNACNGADEQFVDLIDIPKEIKDMAVKASGHLGLSWSRADIIIDKQTGLPYLLEVNRYPGITAGSSEVQGAYTFLASHITPAAL